MVLIGIESSCDETAAAIVKDGREILSSIVSSQVKIHDKYGGVVPELASRKHLENIIFVVHKALLESNLSLNDLDAVAVTQGPGLIGSLLVGLSFAKGFAFSNNLPIIGVNHLVGHINSIFLSYDYPKFPFIVLVVSGGHTAIYYVTSNFNFELIGKTRDDAVGEAYDKVSKMLGLGYPGGPVIESLAKSKKDNDSKKIIFKPPLLNNNFFDFSFSGIKSAVKRCIDKNLYLSYNNKVNIAVGFQKSVIKVLISKVINAAIYKKTKSIVIVGGVAANSMLRSKIKQEASKFGISTYVPSVDLCGDNAAMIASSGFHYLIKEKYLFKNSDVFSKF